MADLTKTVEVIFKGVDDTSAALRNIGGNISGFASSVGSVTGPISNFTTSLLKVEAGIVAVGAAAIAYSVNEAVKFESALISFKKVANDISEKDMPGLIDRVDELAVRYGTTSDQILGSATDFVQAGKTTEEAFGLVEVAATAAVVSELSASQATDVLIRTLAGFQAPASDATRILDILNKVSDSTAASFPELANGMADIAPIAKTMNLSFEETAAFLVPIIERFGSGSEAANALKTAFSRLVDPTKGTREALDEVGISQRAANGEFLTGRPLLEAVQKQFGTLTSEQKLFVAAQLVGINQAARFVPILDDQAGYMKALAAATNSSGSAMAEFKKVIASTEFQFQLLEVAFKTAARNIGDEFSPLVGQGAASLTGLLNSITKVVKEGKLDGFFAALTPIFEDFSRTIDSIAKNLPEALGGVDFTPIKRALDDLRGAFGEVFEGLDISTPEGLARALQQIVDIGASLIDFTRGVVEGFTPFIQKMGEAANEASGMGRELIAGFGQLAGAATAINELVPFVSTLGATITALGTAFGTLSVIKKFGIADDLVAIARGGGLLSTALGKAGLLTATAAAAYSAGEFFATTKAGKAVVSSFSDALFVLTGESKKYDDAARKMLEPTTALPKAAKDAAAGVKELSKEQKVAGETTEQWATRQAELIKLFLSAGQVYDVHTGKVSKQSDVLKEAAQAAQFAEDQQRGYIKSIVDGTTSYEQFGTKFAKSIGKVETEADKATKAADKIKEKMLELSSNERIKAIEFSVKLQTAQIEADTARVKAAFDSVNSSIQNTGNVISSALGALGDVGGFYGLEKLDLIEKQLEKENKYRQDALDLQKDLVEAQINEIDARAEQISKGNALIQIDGKGLEPELEAFMFKILKKIQTRANAEAASFLLGI